MRIKIIDNRVSLLLKFGDMQISTAKHNHCKSRSNDNIKMFLLRIGDVPSMKSKVRNECAKVSKDEMDDHYMQYF